MEYLSIVVLLIVIIQALRVMSLRSKYGREKGDFIAMTLMLSAIPFILLTDKNYFANNIITWLLVLVVVINWCYSLFVFKSSQNK